MSIGKVSNKVGSLSVNLGNFSGTSSIETGLFKAILRCLETNGRTLRLRAQSYSRGKHHSNIPQGSVLRMQNHTWSFGRWFWILIWTYRDRLHSQVYKNDRNCCSFAHEIPAILCACVTWVPTNIHCQTSSFHSNGCHIKPPLMKDRKCEHKVHYGVMMHRWL